MILMTNKTIDSKIYVLSIVLLKDSANILCQGASMFMPEVIQ